MTAIGLAGARRSFALSNETASYPLAGVKVLDFTKLLAGPLCTQYLSDLGADVIKIEDRVHGDDSRVIGRSATHDGSVFYGVNRNKRSLALDLKHPDSKAVVHKLLQWADVLVESFGGGVADRLGLGREAVRAINPSVIYCSISAYGRTGPAAMQAGYELVAQAASGMMMISGEPGGGPIRTAFSPIDQTTGIHAFSSILAALYHRERTGEARYVEASLFETGAAFMALHAAEYWISGTLAERPGSGMPAMCPYQAFSTQDTPVVLAVGNDNLWRKFCDAVGLQAFKDDPRFATNAARVKHREETVRLVSELMATQTAAYWVDLLGRAAVPCEHINTVDKAYDYPQTEARGVLMHFNHPTLGEMKNVAYPGTIEGLPRTVRSHPPLHGEHTHQVLREIGFSEQEIEALNVDQVAGKA